MHRHTDSVELPPNDLAPAQSSTSATPPPSTLSEPRINAATSSMNASRSSCLGSCLSFLITIVIIGALGGFIFYKWTEELPKAIVDSEQTIHNYLEAMKKQDSAAAYQFLSRHVQSQIALSDLVRSASIPNSPYSIYSGLEFQNRQVSGFISISKVGISGRVIQADGQKIPFEAELVYESGGWRIDDLVFADQQAPSAS